MLDPAIRDFIAAQSTLTLATVGADGLPGAAPVFYVPDDDLNLYWLSAAHVRHSQHLAAQPMVAAAIYPAIWEWSQIVGVQIEGRAALVTDDTLRAAMLARYGARFPLPTSFDAVIARSGLYMLRPRWLRYIDNRIAFGHKVEMSLEA